MIVVPYKVIIIVDRDFGEQLSALAKGVPVWIVNSSTNAPVARRLREERARDLPPGNHLTGITLFDTAYSSPEDMLLSHLRVIDLHHGPYSADPPYMQIEVLGAPLSNRIKIAFSEYGFNEFQDKSNSFFCSRSIAIYQALF